MKAAVLHDSGKPLAFEEVPRPEPAANEVLIAVESCGVCHSDLHVAEGDWPQLAGIVKKPLIPGHEIAGRVVEKGGEVSELQIGDRVGVPWIYWTCGQCEPCREGNENLCIRQKITGVSVDGGYAEFIKAPATHATRIPGTLSSEEAAPLFCAGVTVYRALRQSGIASGQRLAVFGVGGLGHLAVQIGREMGAHVTAIDVADDKLELAKTLGAEQILNAAGSDVARLLRKQGGAHVAMVTSATKRAYDTAFSSIRQSGTLMAVGLPAENICFPAIMMASVEVRIRASAVGTRQDLREVLDLAAQGKVRCQVSTRPLEQANEAMDDLRQGKIKGRVVLKISEGSK